MFSASRLFAFAIIPLVTAARAPTAKAVTFDVDRADDTAAATACDPAIPSDCSLRGAIIAANGLADPTTISVPAGAAQPRALRLEVTH
jgi:hypothetical protein